MQVHRLGLQHAEDRAIWDFARVNGFTLVTQDSDFADLAAVLGPPPQVIWLRCGNQPTATIAALLVAHLATIRAFGRDKEAACLELY
jgi:predicted nuclease of predicted toxin-antitoxin system